MGDEYKYLHQVAHARQDARKILIFFSGTDPNRDTLKALRKLQDEWSKQFLFDVVFTAQNKEEQILLDTVTNAHGRVRIHKWVNSLAELILRSDICIGGGGHNTWERACLGLPSLVIPIAENQIEMTKALSQDGYIKASSFDKLEISISEIIREIPRMSRKSLDLVDGLGCERIVEAII